jgi:hypothetical protein
MKKIALYLSSRNNYSLLESFLINNKKFIKDYYLVNVDDFSEPDEIKIGKQICLKHNIPFLHNKKRGLQNAAQTMIDHIGEKFNYVLWLTHDTEFITENFIDKFNNIVTQSYLDEFGLIGFNVLGPQCGIKLKNQLTPQTCGMLGRAPLAKLPGRGGWYRTPDMNLPWDIWGGENNLISVDSPVDMVVGINVKKFKQYIETSENYHLFCAFDDMAMQFLNNNIHNVCIPSLQVWHDQGIKEGKVPIKSASAAQRGDSKHFGDYGPHFKYWKLKWGWDRSDVRNTFPIEKYKSGLIRDFYDYNYKNGPFKLFKF